MGRPHYRKCRLSTVVSHLRSAQHQGLWAQSGHLTLSGQDPNPKLIHFFTVVADRKQQISKLPVSLKHIS